MIKKMEKLLKIFIGIILILNILFAGSLYIYSNSSENIIWKQIQKLI